MGRLIIVATQKWDYAGWMNSQVRSVVQHRVLASSDCPSVFLHACLYVSVNYSLMKAAIGCRNV